MEKKRALIAMSGGVDSSVAAMLMCRQGYDCVGCTMRLYQGTETAPNACCSLDDVEDARSVARALGMSYYVFNFQDEFREKVMEKFALAYSRGLTPNPCIDCNRYMKFSALYRRAQVLDCPVIATGHYARVRREGDRWTLRKAVCPEKDQSYVLYCLSQEELSRAAFPLGELSKEQVRRLAREGGFVNAGKPDSQDICFAPDGDYAKVVEALLGPGQGPGDFVDRQGRVLGKHRGLEHYTVGQHRRLGLGYHEKLYVCQICPEDNRVVLGRAEELLTGEVETEDFNWVSLAPTDRPFRCVAQLRYRGKEIPATAVPLGEGRVRLVLDEPQRAPAPGQAAVLYDGDLLLGGGTVTNRGKDPA